MPTPYAARLDELRPAEQHAAVLGGSTAYWTYGPEDAETTIIAVHGFRGDHHGLEPVFAYLPQIRFIAPDLPGFGASPPLPGRTHDLQTYQQWLTDFVRTVAPGATVLGHSFGSIVAAAAVADGLRTPRLILINPIGAPALEGPRGVLTRLAVFYYWLGARLPERLGTMLLRSPIIVRVMSIAMAKTRDPALRAFIHAQHDAYFSGFADREVLRQAFITSVANDVRISADRIAVPTLLIAAVQDDITPIEKERELAERFPDAELVEIDGVGHLIHYETPAVAALAIEAFVVR